MVKIDEEILSIHQFVELKCFLLFILLSSFPPIHIQTFLFWKLRVVGSKSLDWKLVKLDALWAEIVFILKASCQLFVCLKNTIQLIFQFTFEMLIAVWDHVSIVQCNVLCVCVCVYRKHKYVNLIYQCGKRHIAPNIM